MTARHRHLAVFTRYPEPGTTKTRLVPALGARSAAELQRRMTASVLATARAFAEDGGTLLEVRYEGGCEAKMVAAFGGGCRVVPQDSGNLGRRMSRAFDAAFAGGAGAVVLIGSDCPAVTPSILDDAFRRLETHDLALGSAADGGYYLIGLRAPAAELFPADMPWGEAGVRERTLSIARRLCLSVALLPELSDVDRPEDLATLAGSGLLTGLFPRISVIIPALNEERRVAQAVESAQPATGAEVIVVDGGSADSTMEIAQSAGARVVASACGRARQMNAGANVATGEVFLFLHADSRLPEDYHLGVQNGLADPRVVGGAFEFKLDRTGVLLRAVERMANLRSRRMGLPYGDQALFMRADAFREEGGFPDMPLMEDVEMARRLRARGRLRIVPAPVVTSARRWRERGPLRTTLLNTAATCAYLLGASPQRLARWRG